MIVFVVEINVALILSMISILASIGTVIYNVNTQKRLVRIQGSKIYEERAAVVRDVFKLLYQYKEAFRNFRFQQTEEKYNSERLVAGEIMLRVYRLKEENTYLFKDKDIDLLHEGIECLERMHRWTGDMGHAHWDAVNRKVDPNKAPRVIEIKQKVEADEIRMKPTINKLKKLLKRSIGADD